MCSANVQMPYRQHYYAQPYVNFPIITTIKGDLIYDSIPIFNDWYLIRQEHKEVVFNDLPK